MPLNAWSKHGECLLLPVENETTTPEPTPSEEEENGEGD
jgi:hypothetical protein